MFPASQRSLINGCILTRWVFWRKDAILIMFGGRGLRRAGVAVLVFLLPLKQMSINEAAKTMSRLPQLRGPGTAWLPGALRVGLRM